MARSNGSFGSDKPDVRFGLELIELSELFKNTEFRAFQAPCVKGIRVPGGAEYSRGRLDELTDKSQNWGAKGLAWIKIENSEMVSPITKFFSEDEKNSLKSEMEADEGDLLLLVADEWSTVCHVLGLLRLEIGRPPINEGGFISYGLLIFHCLREQMKMEIPHLLTTHSRCLMKKI